MWTIHELFVGERGVGVNDGGSCCCRPPGSLAGLGIRSFAIFSQNLSFLGFTVSNSIAKIIIFRMIWHFLNFFIAFPLFMTKSKSLPLLFAQSGNDLLTSLFTKEQPWVICSGRSLKKWAKKQFSQDALKKERKIESLVFFWANRSFAHKKRAIRSKKMLSEFPTLDSGLFNQQALPLQSSPSTPQGAASSCCLIKILALQILLFLLQYSSLCALFLYCLGWVRMYALYWRLCFVTEKQIRKETFLQCTVNPLTLQIRKHSKQV